MPRGPETVIPSDEVIQMVYFRLLEHYMDGVYSRTGGQGLGSSDYLMPVYENLLSYPEIFTTASSETANIISTVLLSDEYNFIRSAGSLVNIDWNLKHQKAVKERLDGFKEKILVPYYDHEAEGEKITESGSLWLAAAEDVVGGERLAEHRVYFSRKIEDGDSLRRISGLYGIRGEDFIMHAHSRLTFLDPEEQNLFDFLNEFRTPAFIYERVKDFSLMPGKTLVIDSAVPYTEEWWDLRGVEKSRRELYMKSFIYPWIDEHLPAAFEAFAEDSPYVEYLETFFGLRFADLQLKVERRSIYSNPQIRQVDPDFLNVYSSE